MSTPPRVRMAPSGPEVSRLAYGWWRLLADPGGAGVQQVLARIQTCLDHGITTFDHADIYGGYRVEETFGAALRAQPGLRQKMELVTKCGIMLVNPARPKNRIKHYDYSRQHIVESVENSLRNLATDYIDVLLLHRPSPLMDPDEIAEAMRQLLGQGKVRHLGVSNFTPSQFDMLAARLPVPLVTNQVELHPLWLESFQDGTLDQCMRAGISPMAWSPLAGGRLVTGEGDDEMRVRAVLVELARKYGATQEQILFAWLLRHPSRIIPVVGTNRPERIIAAAGALSLDMEQQDWFELWSAAQDSEVP